MKFNVMSYSRGIPFECLYVDFGLCHALFMFMGEDRSWEIMHFITQ